MIFTVKYNATVLQFTISQENDFDHIPCSYDTIYSEKCAFTTVRQRSVPQRSVCGEVRSATVWHERLTSLGIMETQLRTSLKHIDSMVPRGLSGALNRAPITPRGDSLSDSRCKCSSPSPVHQRGHFSSTGQVRATNYHICTYIYIYIL